MTRRRDPVTPGDSPMPPSPPEVSVSMPLHSLRYEVMDSMNFGGRNRSMTIFGSPDALLAFAMSICRDVIRYEIQKASTL